jgi:hypothetical protein
MIKRFKYTFAPAWLPEPSNLRIGEKNPSYLKSLAAGVLSPIVHLPWIIFYTFIRPLFDSLLKFVLFFGVSFFAGLTGRASGVRLLEVTEERPSEEEIAEYIKAIFKDAGVNANTVRKASEAETKQSVSTDA